MEQHLLLPDVAAAHLHAHAALFLGRLPGRLLGLSGEEEGQAHLLAHGQGELEQPVEGRCQEEVVARYEGRGRLGFRGGVGAYGRGV